MIGQEPHADASTLFLAALVNRLTAEFQRFLMIDSAIAVVGLLVLGCVFWQLHCLLRERQAAEDRKYNSERPTGWNGPG